MSKYEWTFNGRRNSYGEFVLRCYADGFRYPMGDYHTEDKTDALLTLGDMRKREELRQTEGTNNAKSL